MCVFFVCIQIFFVCFLFKNVHELYSLPFFVYLTNKIDSISSHSHPPTTECGGEGLVSSPLRIHPSKPTFACHSFVRLGGFSPSFGACACVHAFSVHAVLHARASVHAPPLSERTHIISVASRRAASSLSLCVCVCSRKYNIYNIRCVRDASPTQSVCVCTYDIYIVVKAPLRRAYSCVCVCVHARE